MNFTLLAVEISVQIFWANNTLQRTLSREWDGSSHDLSNALWHRIPLCLVTRLHIPNFFGIHTFTPCGPNFSCSTRGQVLRPVFPFAPERLFRIVRSTREEHSITLVLWEAWTMCKILQWTFVSNHRSPTNRESVGRLFVVRIQRYPQSFWDLVRCDPWRRHDPSMIPLSNQKADLLSLAKRFFSPNTSNTVFKFSLCSRQLAESRRMSSLNTNTKESRYLRSPRPINYFNTDGGMVNPTCLTETIQNALRAHVYPFFVYLFLAL